jgi:hypothetical protein
MHGTGAETFVVVMMSAERRMERREVVIQFLIINENCSAGYRRYGDEWNKTVQY